MRNVTKSQAEGADEPPRETNTNVASIGTRTVVAFVDVDDTLVRSFGSKRIPNTALVAQVRQLRDAGVELYCWSSGGQQYAQLTAVELGITDCFAGFLPKPNLMIDDQPPAEWRTVRCVHPNQARSMSLAELLTLGREAVG